MLEALTGQLYLVTIIAVLVSRLGRRSGAPAGEAESTVRATDATPSMINSKGSSVVVGDE